MARVQRAVGLLRALGGCSGAPNPAQAAACQQVAHYHVREPVAPAVTNADISEEFYLRQRSQITLGNRHPNPAVGAWISPSAVVVGDVDLFDRVSCCWGCGGIQCKSEQQQQQLVGAAAVPMC
jgi:hypothetical protein